MTGDSDAEDDDTASNAAFDGYEVRKLAIINRKGLHARATAKFVQVVDSFEADIKVGRCGEIVSGHSIMGILTLGAGIGTHIFVGARGVDAQNALDAIAALVAGRFGEDE